MRNRIKTFFLSLILISLGGALPCRGQKAMMFNNLAQYIQRSEGIWIIEVVKPIEDRGLDHAFEASILQTLKDRARDQTVMVHSVFQRLVVDNLYLFFGFNQHRGLWIDNGIISPVPIPATFPMAQLRGKPLVDQVAMLLHARSDEINDQLKRLMEERKSIEIGLSGPSDAALTVEPYRTLATDSTSRVALVKDVLLALQKMRAASQSGDDGISPRYWGSAIKDLKPIRVEGGYSSAFIVLSEDETFKEGLYVTTLISSYIPIGDDVPISDPLSKSTDPWTGSTLYRCKFWKAGSTGLKPYDGL